MGKKSNLLTFGRKLHDIGRVVVEAVHDAGGSDKDAERVFGDGLRRQIGHLVMGKLKLALQPCQINCPELIPDWCEEVMEDVEPTDFKVSDLEFIPFLSEADSPIGGTAMRKKAVVLKANYGLSDAKRLLAEQDKTPAELRRKCYIVFAGTVLRDSHGGLYVAYLHWDEGRWCLSFRRLDNDWCCYDRFPRRK